MFSTCGAKILTPCTQCSWRWSQFRIQFLIHGVSFSVAVWSLLYYHGHLLLLLFLRRSLTSQVIIVAFYSDHEKSDKFCSEALISAWGSFTCHKSMTWDPRLYFPSKGSHTQDFYAMKNPSTLARFEHSNLWSSGKYDNHGTTGVDKNLEFFSITNFYDN